MLALLLGLPESWPAPRSISIIMTPGKQIPGSKKPGTPSNRTSLRLAGNSSVTSSPRSPLVNQATANKDRSEEGNSSTAAEELDVDKLGDSAKTPQKIKSNKKNCPCGKSSGGQCWLLTCLDCNQAWHQSCAGLKAEFNKPAIDSLLKTWQCPWCFTCPFTKPDSHISLKHAQSVKENVLIASTVQSITDTISEKNDQLSSMIKNLEDRLSTVNSDIDAVRGTQEQISVKVLSIADIETHLQHQLLSQASLEQRIKSMQSLLVSVQEQISEIPRAGTGQAHPPITPTSTSTSTPHADEPLCHNQEAVSEFSEDFLDEESAKSTVDFLDSLSFKQESGHSVLAFGAPYKYTGSRSSSEVQNVPNELQQIVDRINGLQQEIFYSQYPDCKKYNKPPPPINSLLINKYEGKDSFLPKHSDDEETMHPESSIFTLSLGAQSTIEFSPKASDVDIDSSTSSVTSTHRSLYRMSRKSQDFYKHEIKAGQTQDGTRYSLTFRSVSRWNNNSTCIVGDSNTGSLNFGNDKRKTFGELMPGHRFWAPTIENIDPSVCCTYKNVVVMCGINNIRKQNFNNTHELDKIYHQYQSKIAEIRKLNPKCKIFVCPILPTKDYELNRGALYFNKLIFEDLIQRDLDVKCIWGFDEFLDSDGTGLLASSLSKRFNRHQQPDMLHLNLSGVRHLAGLIKQSVFSRFQGGRMERRVSSNRVNSQPYSSVAASSRPSTRTGETATGRS